MEEPEIDPESYLQGLVSHVEPFTIQGTWGDNALIGIDWGAGDDRTFSFSLQPIGPVNIRHSNKRIAFQSMVGGQIRDVVLWFPISDRRIARRIARREGMRFSKVGKEYVMRTISRNEPPR